METATLDTHSPTENEHTTPARSSRRALLGLAIGTAIGGIPVGLVAATAKPARAGRRRSQRRSRYKVVTRTFTSAVPITIPEEGPASPYPSTIRVSGLRAGMILDVNVSLSGFTHNHPDDVEVILVVPNGQAAVVLMSEVGGNDDITSVTLNFDDQAANFLPFNQPIVSGAYKPTLPAVAPGPATATLRSFNGLNPNGTWRLYVADSAGGDAGRIGGWALTLKARARV